MSFTTDLVHHPRRLWVRKAVFQAHLWAGVLLSAYLILIAISGSVLVYKDELTRWSLPHTLTAFDPLRTASPSTVLSQFAATEPHGTISNMQVPTPLLPAFLLDGKDSNRHPRRWLADPTTGAITLAPHTWLDTVHDFHYYLLLPQAWGMQANGIGASILLLLAVTGIILWWPGLRSGFHLLLRGMRINLRANWRRVNYDLHSAIGFWTLAIVFWWAFSGVYFGWYQQVTATINAISPLQGMRLPQPSQLPAPRANSAATLDQILQAAQTASPQGHLWSFSDPSLRTGESFILIDRSAPGDFAHRDIIRIRQSDARVLSIWHYGERHSLGDWVLWSMHPLHFGTVWGQTVKLIWFLLGLSLAALTLTGLLMYWNRFLRRRFI